ncbi:MAG TPA: type 2 lanthipeptide synthetase LanM family protein [Pyrinomonadaceae bacterium]
MGLSIEQSSAWHQAATLKERLASLRAESSTTPQIEIDWERGERRLQRWRTQPPFEKGTLFEQRLKMDGTTEDELRLLLAEPADHLRTRHPEVPAWLKPWSEAFAETQIETAPEPLQQSPQNTPDVGGFLLVVEPLIRQELKRFREDVDSLVRSVREVPFDTQTIVDIFAAKMRRQAFGMLNRTLILELNVARLQGSLHGETPEARFQSFVESLRQKEVVLGLLQEYPVLARQLTLQITHWLDFGREFLTHLCADWESLKEMFAGDGDLGQLTGITAGAGDSHRGGRSVLIAKFSGGVKVVYKPKPLAVDVHLQQFLSWLNQRGNHPPFRLLKVLDRESYGWVEFIAAEACTSPDEVERFYQRQGGYLALLYVLQAADFHFENLIAAGEHPVLIDLESLLHPQIGNSELTTTEQLTAEKMNSSVLRIGLLPQRMWFSADGTGLDLSGLGAGKGQLTPQGVPYWEQTGTDEMHVARKRIEMPEGKHRPSLNDAEVNLLEYGDAITTGFTSVYQTLLSHRDELLATDGPLASFATDEVRAIMRPTKTYGELLHEGTHPDFLRDGLDRERFFDRLWLQVEQQPYLERIIPAEREDLENGDIPMFTTRAGSCDLWTSSHQRIPDFFQESGFSRVQRVLRRMSDADLAQQVWFIRASFTSLSMDSATSGWAGYEATEVHSTKADREQVLAAACAIGDRLEQLALQDDDGAMWIGLTLMNERTWSLQPLGADLYNGVPGVALFLAQLGSISGNERYTLLAEKALETVRRQIVRGKESFSSLGAFSGWGGLVYTLTQLGVLWRRPSLLSEAEELVEVIADGVERDEFSDVLSGAAGAIVALRGLYQHAPSARILSVATACGDRLLARAQKFERGIGWPSLIAPDVPLTGFSHGAAGIAWALLQLNELTGDIRFREAALSGMEYERSLFSPEIDNWRDLRQLDNSENGSSGSFITAWCHGAPGVGLGRLHSLKQVDDAEIRSEIKSAIKNTLAHGFGQNHSLCHGDLGNLEFLSQAAEILSDAELQVQVESRAASVLESMKQHGWLCGVPLSVETPGLMTGLAGIGYGLLRLLEPSSVPSVLVLAPSGQTSSAAGSA